MSSYVPSVDDFDSFIDFNGGVDTNYAPDEHQTFSGPSHEYDRFRQQTGFPSGSMSNVTAYNDVNMEGNDFMAQPDFNSSYNAGPADGYNSGISFDMDFEQTPRAQPFFSPSSGTDNFVDPSAVYEPQKAPMRMYPGMHSQQAEQAKAAALAKQQQQLHMQQRLQPQQQAGPSSSSSSSAASQGKKRAGSTTMSDAVAEKKISDILDNMRHKSAISPIDEEDDDTQSAKARKEEEELDEDERLLASEEGKKLSSKERRQLRNKVSARAFRSRRKEYISQLEGDLATKTSEANDLRLINRKLLEENNQLKNLTRTVLSHPSFHSFLEDMSRNPTFVPPPSHMTAPKGMEPTLPSNAPQPEVKQEPEQHQQQQQFQAQEEIQVNTVQVPQNSLDLSMLNLGNNHWGQQGNTSYNFQQPQVFAVYELPQGPSMEELARTNVRSTASPSEVSHDECLSPRSVSSVSDYPCSTSTSSDSTLDNVEDCLNQINSLFANLQPSNRRLLSQR